MHTGEDRSGNGDRDEGACLSWCGNSSGPEWTQAGVQRKGIPGVEVRCGTQTPVVEVWPDSHGGPSGVSSQSAPPCTISVVLWASS